MKQELIPLNKGLKKKNKLKAVIREWARRQACRFGDWLGVYNVDISTRLLGHFRLYRHFKIDYEYYHGKLPPANAYILYYRSMCNTKFRISRATALFFLSSWSLYYSIMEIAQINRLLVNGSTDILHEFLLEAESNYEAACARAMERIKDPSFLNKLVNKSSITLPPKIFQINQENNNHTTNNHQYNTFSHTDVHTEVHNEIYQEVHQEFHTQSIVREGIKGKEKGVFSKKQILILFDLLGEDSKIDKIDFTKPNKFGEIAGLFHAITGKGRDTFIEELQNARNKGLYTFHTQGELNQLLTILTNFAEIFRKAGQKSIAKLAEKKIMELEAKKKKN
ncbi:hypothetical protein ACX0G9_10120 [Flavitalea flava]